jgi:hypothetical protein
MTGMGPVPPASPRLDVPVLHQVAQQVDGAAVGEEVEAGGAGEIADQLLKLGVGAGAHQGAACRWGPRHSTAQHSTTAKRSTLVVGWSVPVRQVRWMN